MGVVVGVKVEVGGFGYFWRVAVGVGVTESPKAKVGVKVVTLMRRRNFFRVRFLNASKSFV